LIEGVHLEDRGVNGRILFIIVIFFFFHGLGCLTCSGIDVLPSQTRSLLPRDFN
jgi:hypothetical protein